MCMRTCTYLHALLTTVCFYIDKSYTMYMYIHLYMNTYTHLYINMYI